MSLSPLYLLPVILTAFALATSGRVERSTSKNDGDVMFADGKAIQRIRDRSIEEIVSRDFDEVKTLDFDVNDERLYWMDQGRRKIYRSSINGTGIEEVISWGLPHPYAIAVDWVGRYVVWSDVDPRFILATYGSRIWIAPCAGDRNAAASYPFRKVLVWTDLHFVRAIALDVIDGHVYWGDFGAHRIERCRIDGADRRTIVRKKVRSPNGLTIDHATRRLYWTDSELKRIEYIFLNGTGRTLLSDDTDLLHAPYGITVQGTLIYWTDINRLAVFRATKEAGAKRTRVVGTGLRNPYQIGTYELARQPLPSVRADPCRKSNGNCSHFCFFIPPGHVCGCPTGIRMKSDGVTCASDIDRMIFFTRHSDIRLLSLDVDASQFVDVAMRVDVTNAIGITHDPVDDLLYWSELLPLGPDNHTASVVRRARRNGTELVDVVTLNVGAILGLAVDWIGRNLYWTDPDLDSISVSRLDGTSAKKLITRDLDKPRAIAVDPYEKYLYWSDWGIKARIERSYLDGQSRTVLVSENIKWPNGLAVDLNRRRLYWSDAGMKVIEYLDLTTNTRHTLVGENLEAIFGIALLGDHLYWTNREDSTIERVRTDGKDRRKTLLKDVYEPVYIQAVDRTQRVAGTSVCSFNNGGCSHLCLATPTGRTCACPEHFILNGDTECNNPHPYLIVNYASPHRGVFDRVDVRAGQLVPSHVVAVTIPVASPTLFSEPVAVDYDFVSGRLFWSDSRADEILSANLDGTNATVVIDFEAANPCGLAVDWMAGNLYWTVVGRDRIDMAKLDGTARSSLVYERVEKPQGLVVYPSEGLLFFTMWGSRPGVYSARMSAKNSLATLSASAKMKPAALTLDYDERLLYWIELNANAMYYTDLNTLTTKRLVVTSGALSVPSAITTYDGILYWANVRDVKVEVARTRARDDDELTPLDLIDFNALRDQATSMDLVVFHHRRQMGENTCASTDVICTHLCISGPRWSSKCACPIHLNEYWTTNEHKKPVLTCKNPPTALLYVDGSRLRHAKFGALHGPSKEANVFAKNPGPDPFLPTRIAPADVVVRSLKLDAKRETVFWLETLNAMSHVYASHLDGSNRRRLFDADAVYDLAVNPVASQLYFTNENENSIDVVWTNGTGIGSILRSSSWKPRSLAINSNAGHLFWTDWASDAPAIRRCQLDGSKPTRTILTVAKRPTGLTISLFDYRLFWTDVGSNVVESCTTIGKNYTNFSLGVYTSPVGFAQAGGLFFFSDRVKGVVVAVEKDTLMRAGSAAVAVAEVIRSGIGDVGKFVISEDSTSLENGCAKSNGGCSDICVLASRTQYCSCPLHRTLQGSKSCSDLRCPSDYFACRDQSACLPKILTCDGHRDCLDGSDELLNCPCTDGKFACAAGHCIDGALRCNGVADCDDESDEADCPSCRTGFRLCSNLPGRCVPTAFWCDGLKDCPHGEDESSCNVQPDPNPPHSAPSKPSPNPVDASPNHAHSISTLALLTISLSLALLVGVVLLIYFVRRANVARKRKSQSNSPINNERPFEMGTLRGGGGDAVTITDFTRKYIDEAATTESGRQSPSVSECAMGYRASMPAMSFVSVPRAKSEFTVGPPMGGPPLELELEDRSDFVCPPPPSLVSAFPAESVARRGNESDFRPIAPCPSAVTTEKRESELDDFELSESEAETEPPRIVPNETVDDFELSESEPEPERDIVPSPPRIVYTETEDEAPPPPPSLATEFADESSRVFSAVELASDV